MTIRTRLIGLGCAALLLAAVPACSSSPTSDGKTTSSTTSATQRTTTSTTALPSVGYIHGHAASVRSGAGLAYRAIGGVALGEQVSIVGKTGDWYEIQFGDETGFVSGQFVRFTPWVSTTSSLASHSGSTTAPSAGASKNGSPSPGTTTFSAR